MRCARALVIAEIASAIYAASQSRAYMWDKSVSTTLVYSWVRELNLRLQDDFWKMLLLKGRVSFWWPSHVFKKNASSGDPHTSGTQLCFRDALTQATIFGSFFKQGSARRSLAQASLLNAFLEKLGLFEGPSRQSCPLDADLYLIICIAARQVWSVVGSEERIWDFVKPSKETARLQRSASTTLVGIWRCDSRLQDAFENKKIRYTCLSRQSWCEVRSES